VGALLETELWPNLIHGCSAQGVPLFLVNARLSERSARGYARVAGLARDALGALTDVAAQTDADAQRLSTLGAHHVEVTGNLKFDRGPKPEDLSRAQYFRGLFDPRRPVFLAASTREGEEELVLDALDDAPVELLTVVVPRHPQRFGAVAELLTRRGLRFQRRSEDQPIRPDTRVVLGDSMGELPLGGQNLLEACAVGKPVLIGPHTFNFEEATRLAVQAGAAIQVQEAGALGRALRDLLQDQAKCQRMGQAGRELMQQHQGATQRTLALLGTALTRSAAPPR
jgi:3-deoxy-D-manno-octulosonic-acid transferase